MVYLSCKKCRAVIRDDDEWPTAMMGDVVVCPECGQRYRCILDYDVDTLDEFLDLEEIDG